ncbi:vitamin B12 dependent methionine synthase [Chloroflexota bacterium]
MEILDSIPVNLTPEKIYKRLRMRKENETISSSVAELLEIVHPIVKPKAVYEVSYVDNKTDDSLDINGIKFNSRVLRINMDEVNRVFPYVVTCGREIDEITIADNDTMKTFLLDTIKEVTVYLANRYLREYLTDKYALGQISTMAPGSLEDWPITQQKELFSIFGNVEELIGVKLTNSFLMTPIKSTSGIIFPTEVRFESCQLCPREKCIGRRAPYDPGKIKQYEEKVLDNAS